MISAKEARKQSEQNKQNILNKEIPYSYSLELDCHGFIRPKWCPLTEIKNEVIKC